MFFLSLSRQFWFSSCLPGLFAVCVHVVCSRNENAFESIYLKAQSEVDSSDSASAIMQFPIWLLKCSDSQLCRVMLNDRSHNGTQTLWHFFLLHSNWKHRMCTRKENRRFFFPFGDFRVANGECKKINKINLEVTRNEPTQKHNQNDWEVLQDTIEIDSVSLSSLYLPFLNVLPAIHLLLVYLLSIFYPF